VTTENVAILFTDVVGSTALSQRLSAEDADEVRRGHFSVLRQCVAVSGGAEVKNLGDGMMAVFSATSSALNCAVAMQQGVERENRSSQSPIGLRIGVSCGEATREEEDYFGDPVIEAARLCARAEGGQVLVTDLVKGMAGRRSSHQLESVGALELKGLPEAVESYEVVWESLGMDAEEQGGVPLPVRLGHRPNVGVIGRADELAALDEAFKTAEAGQSCRTVLISGEPGQGKTTLVAEAARRAHERGALVLLGRCNEDLGVAYQPFRELLGHYVTHAPERALRHHVESHGGEIERLVPALRQRLPDLPEPTLTDPETERYLLYGAVVGLLEVASRAGPVLVVIDDLHWADKPTLQLLGHLVEQSTSTALLVVGTFRDAELSGTHPLSEALGALRREPGMERLQLGGLDDLEVVTFLETAAGHELDKAGVDLAHAVYRDTDGNPFFVAELLLHLVESGTIVQNDDGRWVPAHPGDDIVLPESVREVIDARVSRIGSAAAKMLKLAAVIGRDFGLDLLSEVTGLVEENLLDLLDEAQAGVLVREVPDALGRYTFAHALIQRTLYDDLGPTRRARAHLQVAEALEQLHGDDLNHAGELAHHYLLATHPTRTDKALTYALRAGEAALVALAPDEAARYFMQALELLDAQRDFDLRLKIDLLIGLGTAQRQVGNQAFRTTLLEAAYRARDLGEGERLVEATLANSRGSFFSSFGVIDAERVEVIEAALDALAETDSSSRARLLSKLCNELAWGPAERRLSLARSAQAMARRIGDVATRVEVTFDCAASLRIPSLADEVRADMLEAIALVETLGDPILNYWAAANMAIEAVRAGDFELAAASLDAQTELAAKLQQPMLVWLATYMRVTDASLHGDTRLAEELASSALEIGTASGQPDAFPFYGTQIMVIRLQQGRIGELVSLIAEIVEQNPGVPSYRGALAAAALDAGDEASARRLVQEAAADGFALPMDTAWLDGIVMYARPTIELAIPSAASALFKLLAPFHRQVPHQGLLCHEPVAMFLGALASVLGRYGESETYFEESSERCVAGSMRFAEAYTNMLWGRMLRTRNEPGDADRARGLLEQARESAATRGYAMVERQANAELSNMS
jgi:class 3 adenylate cyclase